MRTNNDLETRVSALEELSLEIGQECNRSLDLTNKIVKILPNAIKKQFAQEFATRESEIESNVITTVSGVIDTKIRDTLDERGLSNTDADRLTKARYKRMRELLGDSKSDEYKLFIPFYQGCMRNGYLKKFDVLRYADIDPSQFKEALEYIQNFNIVDRSWCIEALHNNYRNQEFTNNKLVHAYERYFGINIA